MSFHIWPGAVFWAPPEEAITDTAAHALDPPYSQYGNDEGISELRTALEQKVRDVNKLEGVRKLPLASQNNPSASWLCLYIIQDVRCVLLRQRSREC